MDEYGRQAYNHDFDPSEIVVRTKRVIARNRAAAEAQDRPDLDPPDDPGDAA